MTETEVKDALLKAIDEAASKFGGPSHLLQLAEAYAWLVNPSQPHGGSATGKQ